MRKQLHKSKRFCRNWCSKFGGGVFELVTPAHNLAFKAQGLSAEAAIAIFQERINVDLKHSRFMGYICVQSNIFQNDE